MKEYTVVSGDTISKIVLREYSNTTTNWNSTLFDCLIRYVAVINNRDLALFDNVPSNSVNDPDSLKPGQRLILPNDIAEAAADPIFQTINNGDCYALFNTADTFTPDVTTPDTFTPDQKNNKYWWWLGGGLLALGAIYLITQNKKKR